MEIWKHQNTCKKTSNAGIIEVPIIYLIGIRVLSLHASLLQGEAGIGYPGVQGLKGMQGDKVRVHTNISKYKTFCIYVIYFLL